MLVDSALPLFLDKCPVLKSIKLENCRKLTDVAIDHMVQVKGGGGHRESAAAAVLSLA